MTGVIDFGIARCGNGKTCKAMQQRIKALEADNDSYLARIETMSRLKRESDRAWIAEKAEFIARIEALEAENKRLRKVWNAVDKALCSEFPDRYELVKALESCE